MNNGIFTIMKKELARFFGDRRMLLTTVLMPGLLIYVIYSLMGNAMSGMFTVDTDYVSSVATVHWPASMEQMTEKGNVPIKLQTITPEEIEDQKKALNEGELDLIAVFPDDFDAQVAGYDIASGKAAPNVELYYNSTVTESQNAYSILYELLNAYETSMTNRFDINAGAGVYDLATKEDMTGSVFASMMPLLLMVFMFSGCMAIAPESIAGEKERGTIATLLVTPVGRGQIALGKITALAMIALLSGFSSTLGTVLSLPKLMGDAAGQISGNLYGVSDYALLAVVILSTVLLLITLISIISAFAKTVKEAQTLVTPLMLVVMLIGVMGMFGSSGSGAWYTALIPLYNSVQSMSGVFSFEASVVTVVITVVSNLLFTGLGVFALTRMFHSEKVIFSQ